MEGLFDDRQVEFVTNALGDVHEIVEGDSGTKFDPSTWEWIDGPVHARRSIDSLAALPGFSVEERSIPRFTPGPHRRSGGRWLEWKPGAGPPAAVESKIDRPGEGTRGHYNRLSDAVGNVAERLPVQPERSPMGIYDFLRGRLFVVRYQAPPAQLEGTGTVYLVEDGVGIKVGFTYGTVAKRISELQTGNSRRITTIAEISGVSPEVESLLQKRLAEWNITGEWYDRGSLLMQVQEAKGVARWLKSMLERGTTVTVHHPYH